MSERRAVMERKSNETQIKVELNVDGKGKAKIKTPIGLLSHMIELFTFHGFFDLNLEVTGDTHIDIHHTNEDIGIVLGKVPRSTWARFTSSPPVAPNSILACADRRSCSAISSRLRATRTRSSAREACIYVVHSSARDSTCASAVCAFAAAVWEATTASRVQRCPAISSACSM